MSPFALAELALAVLSLIVSTLSDPPSGRVTFDNHEPTEITRGESGTLCDRLRGQETP